PATLGQALEQAGLRDDADVGRVATLGEHRDLGLELARALVGDLDAGAGLEVLPGLDETVGLEVEDRAADRDGLALERAVLLVRRAVDVAAVVGDVAGATGERER